MSRYKIQFEDTYKIVNGQRLYELDVCLAFILERGKVMYGDRFVITSMQKKVYYKLLIYAIGAEKEMAKAELDPNKGLLLMGAPGIGKSAMMQLIKPFFTRKQSYDIRSCSLLTNSFCHKGFEAIAPLIEKNAKVLCLDQMGAEGMGKHYGVNADVANCLVEHFYENRFDQKYPKLHITTSLGSGEIGTRYGEGFRRMLKEMCNVVVCV